MKRVALLFLLFFYGCTSIKKPSAVSLSLTNNNRSVKFQGLDAAILGEIRRDSIPGAWQTLIPVYRMPVDTNLKNYQLPQPGKYEVEQKAVIFTPDTPFIKGRPYFLRYYHFDEGKSVFDMVKNKTKLGSQPYSDLVFSSE